MNEKSNIKYLKYSEIDFDKWNSVIDEADNCLIYAHACFLDMVSPKWEALVYKDYKYIMPITTKKKIGVSLLQQPQHCQQLGIFPSPSEDVMTEFMDTIKKRFKYISINFNNRNSVLSSIESDVTPFQNFLLNLNPTYEDIASSFSSHTLRHLKKSYKNNLRFAENIKPSVYIDFKKKNQDPSIYKKSIKILNNMIPELFIRDRGNVYAVFDENNEMCAAAVFVFDRYRIIYLNGVTSQKGKDLDAMYFLMDCVIKKYAGSEFYLDFEGSRIPGIARFFEGFGAEPETYYNFKYNKLPLPLRWIKK